MSEATNVSNTKAHSHIYASSNNFSHKVTEAQSKKSISSENDAVKLNEAVNMKDIFIS